MLIEVRDLPYSQTNESIYFSISGCVAGPQVQVNAILDSLAFWDFEKHQS